MKLFGKKNGPKATGGDVAKNNAGRSSSSKGGAGKEGRDLEVATIGTTNGNATVDSTRATKRADNLSGTSTFQRTMSYLASFFSIEVGLSGDDGVDVKHSLPGAPPTKEDEAEPQRTKRNRKILLLILILALLGTAAFLVVFFLTRKDSPSPLQVDRTRLEILEAVLAPVVSPLETLQDESTPQHRAITWFADDDPAYPELEDLSDDLVVARYVSALLYFATEGENWRQQLNFMSDAPVCEWNDGGEGSVEEGIVCDSDDAGRIDGIVVDVNNLNGTLPTELAALGYIKNIGFALNKFVGTIPTEYGSMSSLTKLSLSGNALTGTLATELAQLTNLQSLQLHWNQLQGTVPASYGQNLTSLQNVHLEGNSLSGNFENSFCGRGAPFEEIVSDCGRQAATEDKEAILAEVTCFCCTKCCFNGDRCRPLDEYYR